MARGFRPPRLPLVDLKQPPLAGQRVDGLDLLRGIAIGLVLLRHAWPDTFGGAGVAGVVIFFALSGYLITGLLLGDLRSRGRIDYRRFYRSRAYRLLPALVFFLVGVTAVGFAAQGLSAVPGIAATWVVGLLYLADLPLPFEVMPGASHLWSLAVEEQFYLVWPLLLSVAWVRARTGQAILGMACLFWFLTVGVLLIAPGPEHLYELPVAWIPALMVGVAGRYWQPAIRSALPRRRENAAALLSLVFVAVVSVGPQMKGLAATYLVVTPLLALAGLVLVFWLERWVSLPTRWLEPLRLLGLISYAAYLWNYLVVIALQRAVGEDGALPFWAAVLSIPATLAIASLSWVLVERPMLARKKSKDAASRRATSGDRNAVLLGTATRPAQGVRA